MRTRWSQQAIEEVGDILANPVTKTGWDGIGYSVLLQPEDRNAERNAVSSYGLRYGDHHLPNLLRWVEQHQDGLGLIRYYAAYGPASPLDREVICVTNGPITVRAKILFYAYGDGTPAPTVGQIHSSDLTMTMIREMSEQMSQTASRLWLHSLLPK